MLNEKKFNARIKRLEKQGVIMTQDEIAEAKSKLLAGFCDICGGRFDVSKLCLDHNHKTKHFRGVLCQRCNYMGGYIDRLVNGQGNIELLPAFYSYLQKEISKEQGEI